MNHEALSELILPLETVTNEIFPFMDEFTRFAFALTCKYFASPQRNSSCSLPLYEALLNACESGYFDFIKFFAPGAAEFKYSPELCYCAAFNGHLEILQWFASKSKSVFPLQNGGLLLHAAFNDQLEVVRWLLEMGAFVDPDLTQIVSRRGLTRIEAVIKDYLKDSDKQLGFKDGQEESWGTTFVQQNFYSITSESKVMVENLQSLNYRLIDLHYSLIKKMIVDGSAFISVKILEKFARIFNWRMVKMICDLQLPRISPQFRVSAPPKPASSFGDAPEGATNTTSSVPVSSDDDGIFSSFKWETMVEVEGLDDFLYAPPHLVSPILSEPKGVVSVNQWWKGSHGGPKTVYSLLGDLVTRSGRVDLIDWFIDNGFIATSNIRLIPLFQHKNFTVARSILSRPFINPVRVSEAISLCIESGYLEELKWMHKKKLTDNLWSLSHLRWVLSSSYFQLQEWVIFESGLVKIDQALAKEALNAGCSVVFKKLVPTILSFQLTHIASILQNQINLAGKWECIKHAFEIGAIKTIDSSEVISVVRLASAETVAWLFERKYLVRHYI